MDDEASNLSTFDIYSDLLIEKQTPSVSVEELEKKNAENEAKLKELTEQLQNLQSQNTAIVEENKVLKTNISQLFKTAQAEVKRKDRQLEELTQRRPFHEREWDLKSSINDRLRDMRKTTRSSDAGSDSVDHRTSRETHRRRSPESSRSRHSPREKEKSTRSSSSLNSNHERNQKSSASERNVCEKNLTDQFRNHLEKPSEDTCFKDTNDQRIPSADTYKKNDSKKFERTESENLPTQRHLHNYRIPKKSNSSGTNHRSSSRERAECRTSPRVSTSQKLVNDKKASHESRSPSRHTRDREHCTRSPVSGQSNERSKSRERLSWYSKRGANKASEEHIPGRKRRRASSERRSVSYDSELDRKPCEAVPRKRHRRESNSETRKRECNNADVLQRSKNHKLEALSDHKVSFGTVLKEHESEMPGLNIPSAIENDEHRRKRHESSQKNKSVKRAKDLLHKMHSTPKEHKERKDRKKHKHRKRCSSTKHKSKERMEETQEIDDNVNLNKDSSCNTTIPRTFEDGEMLEFEGGMGGQEIASALVNDEHKRKRHKSDRKNKSVKRAKEILHKMHGSPKKHRHEKEHKKHSSKRRRSNETTGDTDKKHEQKLEDNNLNLDSVSKNTSTKTFEEGEIPMCAEECSLDVDTRDHSTEPSLPDHDNPEKVEKVTAKRNPKEKVANEISDVLETGTGIKDGSQTLESSHTKSSPACKDKETVVEKEDRNSRDKEYMKSTTEGQIKIDVSKQTSPLKQPDTARFGYSSEHETVLVCGPSSQEEDSYSESDSRSTSLLSSSLIGQTVPSHETVRNWLQDEIKEDEIKEEVTPSRVCKNVSLPQKDGILRNGENLERSTFSIQPDALPQAENNSKLCQTHKDLDTEVKQPDATSTADKNQSISFFLSNLKSLPSPVKNTTDSFSETIREVFGSNSFLESDDLESSKEMQVSFRSADKSSLLPETSNSCLEKENSYKHSNQPSLNQSTRQGISEETQNIRKGDCVVQSDDLKKCHEAHLISSETAPSLDDPKTESKESSFSEAEKCPNNSEKLALEPEVGKASLAEAVFEIFGSNSFVEDGNDPAAAAETSPVLVPEQPTLHSEEATSGFPEMPPAFDKCETDNLNLLLKGADTEKLDYNEESVDLNLKVNSEMETVTSPANEECVSGIGDISKDDSTSAVVQGLLDENPSQVITYEEIICKNDVGNEATDLSKRHSDESTTLQGNNEAVVESGIKLNVSVIEDVAEVSLDLPSCDTLSFSASPAHSSFMEDSGDSHQSGKVDKSYPEVFKNSDAEFHSDQDTPSGTANLSDGEIVSSSDSEVARTSTSTKSKHRSDKRHKEANHTINKSSRKRSRSKERTSRSHKEESRPTRQGRERLGKDVNRSKFFDEKLRILNERLKERSELDRKQVGHPRSRLRSDDHECPSLMRKRLGSTVQRVGDERKIMKPADHRDRHRTSKDDRHRESRLAEDAVSSSRHAASRYGTTARKYDSIHRIKSPPRSKVEKGRRTSEDERRDRRREYRW